MAKTVGQAFNIAYHEFLKVNRLNVGELEDMEYNGILEQQKILGEELSLLADESKTKEVREYFIYSGELRAVAIVISYSSIVTTRGNLVNDSLY